MNLFLRYHLSSHLFLPFTLSVSILFIVSKIFCSPFASTQFNLDTLVSIIPATTLIDSSDESPLLCYCRKRWSAAGQCTLPSSPTITHSLCIVKAMAAYYYSPQHHQPSSTSSHSSSSSHNQSHNHHGGRSRRAPRSLASQNSHRPFRGVRSMKELTENQTNSVFRARFEAGRSFDLDDDLEFCPSLLTEDDVSGRPP